MLSGPVPVLTFLGLGPFPTSSDFRFPFAFRFGLVCGGLVARLPGAEGLPARLLDTPSASGLLACEPPAVRIVPDALRGGLGLVARFATTELPKPIPGDCALEGGLYRCVPEVKGPNGLGDGWKGGASFGVRVPLTAG